MPGAECPGHKQVYAAIVTVKFRQNQTDRCIPCPNGSPNNLETCWRRNGTGAPLANRPRQQTPQRTPEPTAELTPELTPSLLGTPPAPLGNNCWAQHAPIFNVAARYAYSYTALPCAESFTLDACAQDSPNDPDFDLDMLNDNGTATRYYTMCCLAMQLTFILMTTAANWVNLAVMTSIDR